jgi:hypothetical protein
MGLVMKQAGGAFGGSGEDKQSAMNGAAMTVAKLVAQKQLTSFIGGSNSGGLGMFDVGKAVRMYRLFCVPRLDGFHAVAHESIWVTCCSDIQCTLISACLVKVN